MSDKKVIKPVALAVGAALASTFAFGSGIASAGTVESPFAISTLSAGYLLGEEDAGGGKSEPKPEDKDGEAHCGGDEGHCGGEMGGEDKDGEGACGEGSCGGDNT